MMYNVYTIDIVRQLYSTPVMMWSIVIVKRTQQPDRRISLNYLARPVHYKLCLQQTSHLASSIYLPNINQFSKFFYRHARSKISNEVICEYPTTP